MKTIHVAAGRPYDIRIGGGLLGELPALLTGICGERRPRLALITDDRVNALADGARRPVFSQLSKMRARSSDITLTAQDPSPVVVFQQQQRVITRGAEHIAKLPQCQRIARFKPRLHARIDG